MDGQIYLLIDKRNGKKYIGKHNGKKKNYFSGGIIPNKIIKKLGTKIFERIILEDNIETLEELNKKEIWYIKEYDTFRNGYNLTEGGDGGGEWIFKRTKEEIEKLAEIKSTKLKNRVFSQETRKKMSDAKINIPLTPEHIENIKKSQAGEKHPWFGRSHTEESKEKIRIAKKGRKNPKLSEHMLNNTWNKKKISIEGILYESTAEASRILNITRAMIRGRCNSEYWKEWFKL